MWDEVSYSSQLDEECFTLGSEQELTNTLDTGNRSGDWRQRSLGEHEKPKLQLRVMRLRVWDERQLHIRTDDAELRRIL